jgi:hypothetical protein
VVALALCLMDDEGCRTEGGSNETVN